MYGVFLPYVTLSGVYLDRNLLKSLARPTGIEPVFPP
jgi:hypothetical protein